MAPRPPHRTPRAPRAGPIRPSSPRSPRCSAAATRSACCSVGPPPGRRDWPPPTGSARRAGRAPRWSPSRPRLPRAAGGRRATGSASRPDPAVAAEIATVLGSGDPVSLLLGGPATGAPGLAAAARIAAATGARTLVETFPARLTRGAGVPAIERLGYLAEQAGAQLDGIKHLIVAGTRPPVTFFAYPDRPSDLVPDGAVAHHLAGLDADELGRASCGR